MAYTLAASYRVGSFLTSECRVSYLDGHKITQHRGYITAKFSEVNSARMLWISPGIKFMPQSAAKLIPYASVHACFGVLGEITQNETLTSQTGMAEITFLLSKEVAFGMSSSIGLTYQFSPNSKWTLFSEIHFRSASFGPGQGEITRRIVNGADQLSSLSTNDKVVVYEDNYIQEYNQLIDPSKPTVALKRYYPFSSLGLNVGLAYKF